MWWSSVLADLVGIALRTRKFINLITRRDNVRYDEESKQSEPVHNLAPIDDRNCDTFCIGVGVRGVQPKQNSRRGEGETAKLRRVGKFHHPFLHRSRRLGSSR